MECQSPQLSEVPDSPPLSYSMAKREGRRIVGLLEELMSTPLMETQQPSLVDFSLTNTPESTSAGALRPPCGRLFQTPTPPSRENGAAPCVGNLLDTTYPRPLSSSPGLTSALTRALEELDLSSGDIDEPEVIEAECSNLPPVGETSATSRAFSETDIHRGVGYITGDDVRGCIEPPSPKNEANGTTPFASPFAALPANKDTAPLQVQGPLISFSPAVPETARKLACDRTATIQSSSEGTLASLTVGDSSAALPHDAVLNGCAKSTVVPTTNFAAAATALQPDGDFPTVVVDRCELVTPELPHLLALRSVEDSLVTVGDDSFRTAYDASPLALCRRSFAVSRDEPLITSSDSPLASSQDGPPNALENSSSTTAATEMTFAAPACLPSDSPNIEVTAATGETTFAVPDGLPSGSPAVEAAAAAAEMTFAVPDSLPSCSPAVETAAAEMAFAVPDSLPSPSPAMETAAAAAETTFAVPDGLPTPSPAVETAAARETTFAIPDSLPSPSPAVEAAAALETTFAAFENLPSDSTTTEGAAAAETTFAVPDSFPSCSPPLQTAAAVETTFALPAPRPPLPSTLQAFSSCGSAAGANVAVASCAPGKFGPRPAKGVSLQTRKSLLPPPATSQRPGRVSTLVKPRAPLGRPSAAPKAAEESSATGKTAQLASGQKEAQHLKQEQGPARSRQSVPFRRPLAAPSAKVPAASSRQTVPAPGVVANGAAKHTASRLSAVTKVVAPAVTSSTSSVPAPRTGRLPPPSTTAVAGARTASLGLPKVSAAATSRGGSTKAVPTQNQANGMPPAQPQARQQTGLPRSRIAPPRTRVAGFSRLPTMAGSSANNRAALLMPVAESPDPKRLSSTPLRSDLSPLDAAACPDLTPIRRQ